MTKRTDHCVTYQPFQLSYCYSSFQLSFCIALENGDILRCNAETKAGDEDFQKCSEKEAKKKEPEHDEAEEEGTFQGFQNVPSLVTF